MPLHRCSEVPVCEYRCETKRCSAVDLHRSNIWIYLSHWARAVRFEVELRSKVARLAFHLSLHTAVSSSSWWTSRQLDYAVCVHGLEETQIGTEDQAIVLHPPNKLEGQQHIIARCITFSTRMAVIIKYIFINEQRCVSAWWKAFPHGWKHFERSDALIMPFSDVSIAGRTSTAGRWTTLLFIKNDNRIQRRSVRWRIMNILFIHYSWSIVFFSHRFQQRMKGIVRCVTFASVTHSIAIETRSTCQSYRHSLIQWISTLNEFGSR